MQPRARAAAVRWAGEAVHSANIGRTLLALAVVTSVTAASGFLPSTASAEQTEAVAEVYVEHAEWTPAEGWPPEHASLASTAPVWWTTFVEKGDVAPNGGVASSGMSVEQIGALSGIPREYVTGLDVKSGDGERCHLSRSEALGGAGTTPYLDAEGGEAAKSVISLVAPGGCDHAERISSGALGALVLVFQIQGDLIQLAPLNVSPPEPTAGTTVEFGEPHAAGGLLPGSPHRYRWMFGDGASSNEAAPQHAYPNNAKSPTTSYEASVELVEANFNGEEIAAGTQVVTVPVKNTAQAQPEAGTGATGPPAPAPGPPAAGPAGQAPAATPPTSVADPHGSRKGRAALAQRRAGGRGPGTGAGGHGGGAGAGGRSGPERSPGTAPSRPSETGAGPPAGPEGGHGSSAHGTATTAPGKAHTANPAVLSTHARRR